MCPVLLQRGWAKFREVNNLDRKARSLESSVWLHKYTHTLSLYKRQEDLPRELLLVECLLSMHKTLDFIPRIA